MEQFIIIIHVVKYLDDSEVGDVALPRLLLYQLYLLYGVGQCLAVTLEVLNLAATNSAQSLSHTQGQIPSSSRM